MRRWRWISLTLLFCSPAFAQYNALPNWIQEQAEVSTVRMYWNISPPGAARGIVIASPSRSDPDYYFHWTRDSALVMESFYMIPESRVSTLAQASAFTDYLELSRELQLTQTLTGLGEPRFHTSGAPYNGDWARPQNDGPALRALSFLRAPASLRALPSSRELLPLVLRTDLRFLIDHRAEPNFDLWEEIKGDHFYTRVVQLAALRLAAANFDPAWGIPAADLQNGIQYFERVLAQHWRGDKKIYSANLNRMGGGENKYTDLDTAVVLGALHAGFASGPFSIRDERVLATAAALEEMFRRIYAINARGPGTAIGRYEDDVYFGGNPWYITTAAFAELHYKLAASLRSKPDFFVTELNLSFLRNALGNEALQPGMNLKDHPAAMKALVARGDQFLARVKLHTPADGGLSEQFSRVNGEPVSARDLTWSYAGFLTAVAARESAIR